MEKVFLRFFLSGVRIQEVFRFRNRRAVGENERTRTPQPVDLVGREHECIACRIVIEGFEGREHSFDDSFCFRLLVGLLPGCLAGGSDSKRVCSMKLLIRLFPTAFCGELTSSFVVVNIPVVRSPCRSFPSALLIDKGIGFILTPIIRYFFYCSRQHGSQLFYFRC